MFESLMEEVQKLKTDKMIILIGLIIPVLVNLMIGWELSKGVIDHIPMAIVDYDNSKLSREVIGYFSDNNTFTLAYRVEDENKLQSLLDTSKVKVGMIIPKNFSEDVIGLRSPSILMLYDGSHMSITSVAKAKASEILLSIRVGASIKQLEGRLNMNEEEAYHTAMPINFENRTLYNPSKNFNYFMTPGYGTIICQTGIGLTAVLCIDFIRQGKKRKSNLGYTLGKTLFYGLLGSISFIMNVLVQIYLFKLPFRGSLGVAMLLSIMLAFAIASMSIAVSTWISNRVIAIVVIGLLLIPNSIMAGYTWPVISMLPFYQKVSHIIPFYHYGDNIRNLFLKGELENLGGDIYYLLFFIISMLVIALMGNYKYYLSKVKGGVENDIAS
ncbi:hypothetical protein CS063_13290 [Sporanaerobium hydrogeniformans]|uniref:Uncharacterized protein n=1 Tax=Sporanaerobium hydrogeniformans TaxID=3072179 RepID=A0AC61DAQ5_9FIRM|nr:ABC transporter permease [Sporanaerobium hydrogeniformans]PHV69950.1 hypothetical protein CS063_13290 [Sporanaerobium hydrogeniformans]